MENVKVQKNIFFLNGRKKVKKTPSNTYKAEKIR